MAGTIQCGRRSRRDFGKIPSIVEIPNLIEVQKRSYETFLQKDVTPDRREEIGLQAVFKSVFPIADYNDNALLEFDSYHFGDPKYTVEECHDRGMTFAIPLKVTLRLVVFDHDKEAKTRTIREQRGQEVYLGELPLMTEKGTFIINGTERVVVSQLQRSAGVFFDDDKGKTLASGKPLFSARVIPYRGSWVEFDFDANDLLHVRVDRRRKMYATAYLRAFWFLEKGVVLSDEEILAQFYDAEEVLSFEDGNAWVRVHPEASVGAKVADDVKPPRHREPIVTAGKVLTAKLVEKLIEANVEKIPLRAEALVGRRTATRVVDTESGEVLVGTNTEITSQLLSQVMSRRVAPFKLLVVTAGKIDASMYETLARDHVKNPDEALVEIYRKLRPGDPPTVESARALFRGMFIDPRRYDLARVGRFMINEKLQIDAPANTKTLRSEDIVHVMQRLLQVKLGSKPTDDIDHLGNRRVRSVGELLENQFRVGLTRMERAVKERMSISDTANLMPHDLINAKPVSAVVKEFFGSSQLSQFMDQTNPLAELTHKRRLSALGPGGLSRDRAGFDVRDVHPSHYGRVCPIETPEGPNIGLMLSLATYGKINQYGFIETPYRRVISQLVVDDPALPLEGQILRDDAVNPESGKVVQPAGTMLGEAEVKKIQKAGIKTVRVKPVASDIIDYLSADREEQVMIAQANTPLDEQSRLLPDQVVVRVGGGHRFPVVPSEQVAYMDVSPKQVVSVGTALIPFLEHDDANRALMGANMQKQAVPLLQPRAPVVGTGVEHQAARDSGQVLVAGQNGVVRSVSGRQIVIVDDDGNVHEYNLQKFVRSNQDTCINQRPSVRQGDRVTTGQIIADSSSTENGELALGQNVVVAFMPWEGGNFEDAILISERLVRDDVFTSIHIEKYETEARDTKLGPEEITRDIPNVGEESLANLDENGVIRIGAEVRPNDILVGKVTPRGETELSAEERLLRAIFGEKAREVKDTSLRVPHGVHGKVIDVKTFRRDDDSDHELPAGVNEMVRVSIAQKRKISEGDKMAGRHGNKGVISRILPIEDMPYLPDGQPVDIILNPIGVPSRMNLGQVLETHLGWAAQGLNFHALTPVFDGARDNSVEDALARV